MDLPNPVGAMNSTSFPFKIFPMGLSWPRLYRSIPSTSIASFTSLRTFISRISFPNVYICLETFRFIMCLWCILFEFHSAS